LSWVSTVKMKEKEELADVVLLTKSGTNSSRRNMPVVECGRTHAGGRRKEGGPGLLKPFRLTEHGIGLQETSATAGRRGHAAVTICQKGTGSGNRPSGGLPLWKWLQKKRCWEDYGPWHTSVRFVDIRRDQ